MALISELDAQHDPDAEKAWLETLRRRRQAVVDDTVEGVPADVVFDRIRSRLGE